MLYTPGMRRRTKAIDTLLERIESVHTPAQRAGCPRDLADDILRLHASDPQFLPESNLRFALSAALIASVYLGEALSFAVYAMVSQPEFHELVRSEADALIANGESGWLGLQTIRNRRHAPLSHGDACVCSRSFRCLFET